MADADLSLSADDIAWVKAYAAEVVQIFGKEFAAAIDRFNDGQVLLNRINAAIESVLKNGSGHFQGGGRSSQRIVRSERPPSK